MALVTLRQLLDHAAENNYGVPAFNVNNLEQVRAIMEAANETDSPVIMQASAGARKYAGAPFLRKVALRLPRFLWPVPPSRGHLIAFDEDGRVLADLQDPSGRLPETSGATEYHGRLYVQSLHASAFGVLPDQ